MVGHVELDVWSYRLVGVGGWACRCVAIQISDDGWACRCVAIQISGCGWVGM